MSTTGLLLASRYALPPNSLSLCGPSKQSDLSWYTTSGKVDKGTTEILTQFQTLYPYLKLIASENRIKDPFDPRVVEAYWIGNSLLGGISNHSFINHFSDILDLKRKLPKKTLQILYEKMTKGGLPHHAFHVVNVWKRTGNIDNYHNIQTMDACIIQIGIVQKILKTSLRVRTNPLQSTNDLLRFGPPVERTVLTLGKNDVFLHDIRVGDFVSYHWGRFVEKLTPSKARRLVFYTKKALILANKPVTLNEKNYLYTR